MLLVGDAKIVFISTYVCMGRFLPAIFCILPYPGGYNVVNVWVSVSGIDERVWCTLRARHVLRALHHKQPGSCSVHLFIQKSYKNDFIICFCFENNEPKLAPIPAIRTRAVMTVYPTTNTTARMRIAEIGASFGSPIIFVAKTTYEIFFIAFLNDWIEKLLGGLRLHVIVNTRYSLTI